MKLLFKSIEPGYDVEGIIGTKFPNLWYNDAYKDDAFKDKGGYLPVLTRKIVSMLDRGVSFSYYVAGNTIYLKEVA